MMKRLGFTILILLLFGGGASLVESSAQEFYYTTDVKVFRAGRDKEFRNSAESPLTGEEFAVFKGLNYYPVNAKYRVEARLVKTPNERMFEAETSTGKPRPLKKYGYFEFELDGKKQQLAVYQTVLPPESPNYKENNETLFLPFKDSTNGKETYSAGRYLSLKLPKGETTVLDFNLAYNPSCAFNRKYSCFLVPKQNFLETEIKAGEKIYRKSSEQNSTK
jgi:uncharacterized protein